MNALLETLLEITVSSGIIWAALMASKRPGRNWLSPRAHPLLWLILIAGLVLPVTFETGVHLVRMPQKLAAVELTSHRLASRQS